MRDFLLLHRAFTPAFAAKKGYAALMTEPSTDHGTIVVERMIDAPAARAYTAYADPNERTAWAAPSDTAVFIYEETDFRVGGRDVARCGPRSDPRFRVETRYVDITPPRRVVTTETISETDKLLAANITTIEFFPDGARTLLKVTVQVISFVGPGMIDNTRAGHTGALANMATYLEGRPPLAPSP